MYFIKLILCQGLGRKHIEGARRRVLDQRFQHWNVVAERLPAGRPGNHNDVLTAPYRIERLRLVGVQPGDSLPLESLRNGDCDAGRRLSVARLPRGQGLNVDNLALVVTAVRKLTQKPLGIHMNACFGPRPSFPRPARVVGHASVLLHCLVVEQSQSCEAERHVVLVAGLDDCVIPYGSARFCDVLHAAPRRSIDVVAEGEERV